MISLDLKGGSTKLYIDKIQFFNVTPTGDSNTLNRQEIIDPENNFELLDKAKKAKQLLIEATLSNGEKISKAPPELVDQLRGALQMNEIDQHGNILNTIDIADMNIHAFTSEDEKIFSFFIMASFASRQAKEQVEKEKKLKEDNKRNEDAELEKTLKRNLHKDNNLKQEVKPLKKEYNTEETTHTENKKENSRLIFRRLVETLNEDKTKNKLEKKLESIKEALIKFIKLENIKKTFETELVDKKVDEKNTSIAQLIKNLRFKEI